MAATDNVYQSSLALYLKCVNAVSGINGKSYTANTVAEEKLTTDECGQNANIILRNVVNTSKWDGEITGNAPGGLCTNHIGTSCADPGMYQANMASIGSVFLAVGGDYSESAGEWAKFAATIKNYDGI